MKQKPYDLTPVSGSSVEEPAFAYAHNTYTHSGAETRFDHTLVPKDNDLDWLTPEVKQMLDQRMERIQNGMGVFYTQEQIDQMHRQRKQERIAHRQEG
jgi:hypothetical protein